MRPPAIATDVAISFLRRYLSGFKGYPKNDIAGEKRFAEALQDNALSVEHLEATLKTFEDFFPTVRQIRDVAFGLRPRYEAEVDNRKEWAREFGPPQAFAPPGQMAMHWQAFRDMLYYTEGPARDMKCLAYWEEAMRRALDPKIGNHGDSIAFIRAQAHAMGWGAIMELKASPVPFPYKNPLDEMKRARHFAQAAAPITQSDIDRAKSLRKKTVDVDREMETRESESSDSWDDPDR